MQMKNKINDTMCLFFFFASFGIIDSRRERRLINRDRIIFHNNNSNININSNNN